MTVKELADKCEELIMKGHGDCELMMDSDDGYSWQRVASLDSYIASTGKRNYCFLPVEEAE